MYIMSAITIEKLFDLYGVFGKSDQSVRLYSLKYVKIPNKKRR